MLHIVFCTLIDGKISFFCFRSRTLLNVIQSQTLTFSSAPSKDAQGVEVLYPVITDV